jgi:hypothetical protein
MKLLEDTALVRRVIGIFMDREGFVEVTTAASKILGFGSRRSGFCASCSGMLRELRCASQEACWRTMRSYEGV